MAASFSLIIEDDAGKQIVVPFAKDVITIGRKEGNTIRLTERNVSRFHAKLEKQNGHVLVEDLSSFNGVKLNGDRIAGKVVVNAGDVIEIGDYHLELRAAQAQKAAQNVGPVGSRAGALQEPAPAGGDDFEGDTQRWDPPAAAAGVNVGQPTQEDTMPHAPSGGGFADGGGDTERLDLQHLQSMASQGGQAAPPPQPLGEAQSWPPPPGLASSSRPAQAAPPQPMFGPADLEPTARQPVANVPLGGIAPPPSPSMAPPPTLSPQSMGQSLHEATQDMPMPMPPPQARPAPAPAPTSAPPRAQAPSPPPQRRAAEETEQLRAAPAALNPADDLSVPRLVVLNTIFAGSTFALKAMENVLGRTDDNDIVLEHRSVSRNHAKLVREGERVRILDLKSANGVLVNGEEVEQQVLKSGDIIELGRLKLRFCPVGERFTVPPDEIERARLQDAAGDDAYDDSAQTVNVTSPLRAPRPPESDPPVVAKKPVMLYALLGGLALLVIVLIVVVAGLGGDKPAETPPPPAETPAPTPVGALPVTPEPTPPPEPVKAKPTPPPPPPVETAPPPTPEPELEPVELEEPKAEPAKTPPKKKEKEVDFEGSLREAQQAILGGEFSRAVPILKELEKVNRDDPRIHRNLGISYARLRDNDKAAKHYKRYLELSPNAPDAEKVKEILSKGR